MRTLERKNMNPDNNQIAFVLPSTRGKMRIKELQMFADCLKAIRKTINFDISSRGWCYQLETMNYINKGEFNKVQRIINECRKKGFLPIDFVAEELVRNFKGILRVTKYDPRTFLYRKIHFLKTPTMYYTPDYWYKEKFYIQMLVEKVDLVTLFKPICEKFSIPIANSVGWSSILQRAQMIWRFQEYEEKGHIPVLLYCGDFDPFGLAISDYLQKNIWDLYEGTGWDPTNLIIDRFGLNYDFILEHGLTWIDNLISGQGKKPDLKNPIVKRYVEKYGERKVEANAIIPIATEAEALCEGTILKYLGEDAQKRMSDKKQVIKDEYDELDDELGFREALSDLMKKFD